MLNLAYRALGSDQSGYCCVKGICFSGAGIAAGRYVAGPIDELPEVARTSLREFRGVGL